MMERFKITVQDHELQDLRDRVAKARFPNEGPGSRTWDYGTPVWFAQKVRRYWLEQYDWRKYERIMNEWNHFQVKMDPEFDELLIHFIHQVPPREKFNGKVILMLHGWPGSFWEFHQVIPKVLAAGFAVVVPSLPGYGFSQAPKSRGFNTKVFADMFDSLMTKHLGYKSYYAQGGDWGSIIVTILGTDPQKYSCAACHLNMFTCGKPKGMKVSDLSEEDQMKLLKLGKLNNEGVGYQKIQQTRPQSLGYGLNDSPMGLACWIGEKFSEWSHHENEFGDPTAENIISMDDLLTNICIYWFSQCITSSMRLYYETLGLGINARQKTPPVVVPCGLAELPGELFTPPRAWVNNAFNVRQYTVFPKGGHFAALEVPDLLAHDMLKFFDGLAKSNL